MNQSMKLHEYNSWANTTVFEHLKTLPEGLWRQQVTSVFPSVFDTLAHIYIIDKGWLSILQKEYASDDYAIIKSRVEDLNSLIADDSIDELAARYKTLSDGLRSFIETSDRNTEAIFASVRMSYADVIQHVVNHGTYHRGNISAMLHQLGHKGVPTDYGLYLYYHP